MKPRTISRILIAAVTLTCVVVAAVFAIAARPQPQPPMYGTPLSGTAPPIALTDQNGRRVTLAGEHGHVVVVTFFYTHCPDTCPLTAQKLRTVLRHLGPERSRVRVLIISTDPFGDDRSRAKHWLKRNGMPSWSYLLGSYKQLSPVWKAYGIYASPHEFPKGLGEHTAIAYLIDATGHQRVEMHDTAAGVNFAQDLHVLLDDHRWNDGTVTAPEVGAKAPSFSLRSLAGTILTLKQFRGKPVLLNFWATWCVPCKKEMPLLARLALAYQGRLTIVGVDQQEPADEVSEYVHQVHARYPIALDANGNVAYAYQIAFTPTTLFVDRHGYIRRIVRGAIDPSRVHAQIRNLLSF